MCQTRVWLTILQIYVHKTLVFVGSGERGEEDPPEPTGNGQSELNCSSQRFGLPTMPSFAADLSEVCVFLPGDTAATGERVELRDFLVTRITRTSHGLALNPIRDHVYTSGRATNRISLVRNPHLPSFLGSERALRLSLRLRKKLLFLSLQLPSCSQLRLPAGSASRTDVEAAEATMEEVRALFSQLLKATNIAASLVLVARWIVRSLAHAVTISTEQRWRSL